jgi:hypothetical protein
METIAIQVSEATNTQLDWLVASLAYCDEHDKKRVFLHHTGYEFARHTVRIANQETCEVHMSFEWCPTTNPAQMWPIIEMNPEMQFWPWGGKSEGRNGEMQCASLPSKIDGGTRHKTWFGKTKLIAAARCWIAAELGEVVDVPKVLMVDSPTPEPADAEEDERSTPTPGA